MGGPRHALAHVEPRRAHRRRRPARLRQQPRQEARAGLGRVPGRVAVDPPQHGRPGGQQGSARVAVDERALRRALRRAARRGWQAGGMGPRRAGRGGQLVEPAAASKGQGGGSRVLRGAGPEAPGRRHACLHLPEQQKGGGPQREASLLPGQSAAIPRRADRPRSEALHRARRWRLRGVEHDPSTRQCFARHPQQDFSKHQRQLTER
mmetsp:Transcript_6601/g.15884  ORF Transcript_6601/g.15884 Transcript_6601/m.15884 type:complete len:207 (+) Transcript_6601:453-1073(+)